MAFTLPDLPYAHDALASLGMSKETLEYHHDLHHKAYVDNGNKLIAGHRVGNEVARRYRRGHLSGRCGGAERHLQQRQPALEPQPVLGSDGPGRSKKIPGALEKALTEAFGSVAEVQGRFRRRRCRPVRVGLGLAGQGQGRQPEDHQDRERREPALLRPDRASGLRRVGAQLLHRLPQQAPGLPDQLPRQAGELGSRRRPHVRRALAPQQAHLPRLRKRRPCRAAFFLRGRTERSVQGRDWRWRSAALVWGLSPIYYKALAQVPPLEVLSHRTIWSLVFFAIVLALLGRLGDVWRLVAVATRCGSCCWRQLMISCNWFLFILSVQIGLATEASLGYYIFPIVAVVIGVVAFGERLDGLKASAAGLATVAVALLTYGLGVPPWIALTLALTFGVYAALSRSGCSADPVVFGDGRGAAACAAGRCSGWPGSRPDFCRKAGVRAGISWATTPVTAGRRRFCCWPRGSSPGGRSSSSPMPHSARRWRRWGWCST